MEAPDFWDDVELSQQKMKQLKSLKDDVMTFAALKGQFEDIETLIEMANEEEDASLVEEAEAEFLEFEETFESIRMKTLLSGEYDRDNAILSLHAGAGERSPVIGRQCCTGCLPDGRLTKDLAWRCWILWMEMKRALSP